ncbi:MAG: polysaccharide deacetylase family protein, partial [Microlunatus sp.]|nr:polysaccharide deacetylase family protein [Microlunatus sp.]
MIIRRVVLLLVLALFASISIGVIVGLNSPARSGPDGTLVGSPSLAAPVAPSESVSPTQTAESKQTAGPKRSSTSKPTTKPKKSTASTKASTTSNNKTKTKTKDKSKKKGKKKGSTYLSGPLKEGSGGTVYLTFDDGPGTFTPKILKILSRSGSTATFFHLGVNERGFPKMDAQIRAQGSRVANHSYNHPDLTRLSASQLRWQLRHGPKAKCFRPPYGATNNTVRKAVGKAGMRQVLWD